MSYTKDLLEESIRTTREYDRLREQSDYEFYYQPEPETVKDTTNLKKEEDANC